MTKRKVRRFVKGFRDPVLVSIRNSHNMGFSDLWDLDWHWVEKYRRLDIVEARASGINNREYWQFLTACQKLKVRV